MLNLLSRQRDELQPILEDILNTLSTLRSYHLEKLITSCQCWSLKTADDRQNFGVSLECMISYADLLIIHPDLMRSKFSEPRHNAYLTGSLVTSGLPEILNELASSVEEISDKDCCSIEYLAVRLRNLEMVLATSDYKLHPKFADASQQVDELECMAEKRNLLSHFRETIPSLSQSNKLQLCFEHKVGDGECLTYIQLLRLRVALSSPGVDQGVEEFREAIADSAIVLCRGLFQKIELRNCMLTIRCVGIILQSYVSSSLHLRPALYGDLTDSN